MNVKKPCFLNFPLGKIKLLLLLLFILVIPIAIADIEGSKVFIVKFNYDEGLIEYSDKVIKYGYAPDRKLQPEEGYKAEMISINNDVLYTFKFEVPLDVNIDLVDPLIKSISGGMIILNSTDFALIFPYYDNVKSIVIYNPRDYRVLTVPLIEEQFIQRKSSLWFLLLIISLFIAAYILYKNLRKQHQP